MKLKKKPVLWTLFFAHLLVLNWVVVFSVRMSLPMDNTLSFVDTSPHDALEDLRAVGQPWGPEVRKALDPIVPFEEIDPFDDDAKSWTQFFSQLGADGVLVFDANGDGRNDVYFLQDGQNWTRPTDAKGVLADAPRRMGNVLYLNQGNDERGHPRYAKVADLIGDDDPHAAAELAIEGFLQPRKKPSESADRLGRASYVAVAADFNSDGRLDVLVGNVPPGMFWSAPETSRVLPQFVNPVGREARKSKLPLAAFGQYLIEYTPRHSLADTRPSARGEESEGANTLFLNLGDQDGDGVPEWEDASRRTGIEGFRPTCSLCVADFDLDGDLDVFAANAMDMDYNPGGSKYWAGGANCLYVNQLAETGALTFVERAAEMGDVDGVYDADYPMPDYWRLRRIPYLPIEYSFLALKLEPYTPEPMRINGVEGEQGQISWASMVQDADGDGYPDIWVANDHGFLRLYRNEGGKRFSRTDHARSAKSGYWMALAAGDFNGDLHEDLFVGNLGGAVMNNATVPYVPLDLFDPTIQAATIAGQFLGDKHDSSNALIDGADIMREMDNEVEHSTVLPPDVALPHNYRRRAYGRRIPKDAFDVGSLDPYEFAWGSTTLDVQNDGRMDVYWTGCLYGRGGGVLSVLGTNPGRLLVNATGLAGHDPQTGLRLVDLSAEYHIFNIEELQYDKLEDEGYVYRKAPRQNWGKRDVVTSYDRSMWTSQGPLIMERVTNQDMIQTAENGRATIAADLNGDGYLDVVVRNKGGYDSRSSKAVNLKTMVEGRPRVLPAHDNNYPTPTNFEPGSTRVFMNAHTGNNWLAVRLVDDAAGTLNRDAIGAQLIVNDKILRVRRSGDGSFASNAFTDVHFGLGKETAHTLEVRWPDRERTVTRVELAGVSNRLVTITRKGLVE